MTRSTLNRVIRRVPSDVTELLSRLQSLGYAAFLVGGAVRSLLLNQNPDDYDVATSATPDEVSAAFRRVIPTGEAHGTVTVLWRGGSYEVTTFRTESHYSDGRHPDSVDFVRSIHDDLARRDFTINGMALDPVSGAFLDPHGGEPDLRARIVRAIGDPDHRFREDALRLFRAVRFSAQLEFSIAADTWASVCRLAPGLARVSCERLREELDKMLRAARPGDGFRLLMGSGLLQVVLPELAQGVGAEQRGGHRFDVFEHSLLACDAAPPDDRTVRLAALLHDIGKPSTMVLDPQGNRTFHNHDRISAELAERALRRLRYPNSVIADVAHLIRHHMFHYTPDWSDAAVRRFVARVGLQHLDALFAVRAADSYAQQGLPSENHSLRQLRERITTVLSSEHALSRSDLAVNGSDLAAHGIPRGPAMGVVIDHLLETVLDDPQQNTREQLLRIAREFYDTRMRMT